MRKRKLLPKPLSYCDAIKSFQQNREHPEKFAALLAQLSESEMSLWLIAREAGRITPLDDDEQAMVAQMAAPHLAPRTPSHVLRRYGLKL